MRSFQARVSHWCIRCFGVAVATDLVERSFRFLEEALELVQVLGCTREQAHRLVDYVFDRPVGHLAQEVGGVMVTLAALVAATGDQLDDCAAAELRRIEDPAVMKKIQAKQAMKRGVVSHGAERALPGIVEG